MDEQPDAAVTITDQSFHCRRKVTRTVVNRYEKAVADLTEAVAAVITTERAPDAHEADIARALARVDDLGMAALRLFDNRGAELGIPRSAIKAWLTSQNAPAAVLEAVDASFQQLGERSTTPETSRETTRGSGDAITDLVSGKLR